MTFFRIIYGKTLWYNENEMKEQFNFSNILFYLIEGSIFGFLFLKRSFRKSTVLYNNSIYKWAKSNKAFFVPTAWIGASALSFAISGALSSSLREIHRQKSPSRQIHTSQVVIDSFLSGLIGMSFYVISVIKIFPTKNPPTFNKTFLRLFLWGSIWCFATLIYQFSRAQYVSSLIRKRAEIDERIDLLPEELKYSYKDLVFEWWENNQPSWLKEDPERDAFIKKRESIESISELHEQAIEELRKERDELRKSNKKEQN